MMHCKWLACLVLICGVMMGCESQPKGIVTNSDEIVQVPLGATLEVVMAGNPSTGYVWQLERYDETILKRDGQAKYEPKDTRLAGAGGRYTFVFTPEKAGETTLHFVNRRPWDASADPAGEYTVTVEVLSRWPGLRDAPDFVRVEQ